MTVQAGPFTGLRLHDQAVWGDGELCAKLLGTYEQELHKVIMRIAHRPYGAIVDVGCSDGFYAVGLARIFPGATIYAYDTNSAARELTKANAILNECFGRIQVGGLFDPQTLGDLVSAYGRVLLFVDIEGAEKELISDPRAAQALHGSDLIIEAHDMFDRTITPTIWQTLSPTHRIEIVHPEGRNPNAFAFLSCLTDSERWGLVCENRLGGQHWIFADARE